MFSFRHVHNTGRALVLLALAIRDSGFGRLKRRIGHSTLPKNNILSVSASFYKRLHWFSASATFPAWHFAPKPNPAGTAADKPFCFGYHRKLFQSFFNCFDLPLFVSPCRKFSNLCISAKISILIRCHFGRCGTGCKPELARTCEPN